MEKARTGITLALNNDWKNAPGCPTVGLDKVPLGGLPPQESACIFLFLFSEQSMQFLNTKIA
jgi:hypothetical protein